MTEGIYKRMKLINIKLVIIFSFFISYFGYSQYSKLNEKVGTKFSVVEISSNKDLSIPTNNIKEPLSSNILKYYSKTLILSENINRGSINFNFSNEVEDENFYEKTIFKILLGSFVTLGAAAAYFKIKADKRFKEYKTTNNQSLLDDTNRYDTFGGIAFVLMEVNLGVLIYYFLRD